MSINPLINQSTHQSTLPAMIGTSAAANAIRDEIACAARTSAKVLITGETGVGKDLVARLIHHGSGRRLAPMTLLNCAGLPDSLLESELFGHQRGSFTDAYRDKPGLLEAASRGSVFLDEVGEMSPRMQAVLLRFLETGELQRVGADRPHATADVRVIAATNRDLYAEMTAGRFRQDLFYRLNVIAIQVPALRERREDIAPLAGHYLAHFARQHGAPPTSLSQAAMERLTAHDWPGNVRQLKNVIERLTLKVAGRRIEAADVACDLRTSGLPARAATEAVAPRESVVDDLLARMSTGMSFWSAVYAPFRNHDVTRRQLMEIVTRGLERSSGNYRLTAEQFNMPAKDYKRFMAFLRKHDCHVPFSPFRQVLRGASPGPVRVPEVGERMDPYAHAVAV
jgi:transcriptional regulator with GAF, ATPase, and Fis domain